MTWKGPDHNLVEMLNDFTDELMEKMSPDKGDPRARVFIDCLEEFHGDVYKNDEVPEAASGTDVN